MQDPIATQNLVHVKVNAVSPACGPRQQEKGVEADADRPAFWAKQARELLTWDKDFTRPWTGPTRRSPSGSSAVKSTLRTTPWTAT
jgi:hypothetical protein